MGMIPGTVRSQETECILFRLLQKKEITINNPLGQYIISGSRIKALSRKIFNCRNYFHFLLSIVGITSATTVPDD